LNVDGYYYYFYDYDVTSAYKIDTSYSIIGNNHNVRGTNSRWGLSLHAATEYHL